MRVGIAVGGGLFRGRQEEDRGNTLAQLRYLRVGAAAQIPPPVAIRAALHPSAVPLAELLAEYEVELDPEELESGKYPKDPTLLKLAVMSTDPKYQEQLTPVREKLSLKEGSLECKISEEGIFVPVTLRQPGLNSFKVAVHCETSRGGPVSRRDLVSVYVEPG